MLLKFPVQIMLTFLYLIISACGGPNRPVTIQGIETQSGHFGVPGTGKVIAVDFVRRLSNDERYSVTIGSVAVAFLKRDNPSIDLDTLVAAKDLAQAAAGEAERFLRSSLCIYTIDISDDRFGRLSNVVSHELGQDLFEDLDSSDELYPSQLDNFSIEERAKKQISDTAGITHLSIVSQCLLNLTVGSHVGLAKIDENIVILPQNNETGIAAFQG
ncbi:MAG: hypothetical protein AAF429_14085 [Pseudomonadota bacterium]